MKISDSTKGALDVFARARDTLKDAKSGSLVDYTSSARVEPIVLLDDTLRHQPYMTDILQSLVSIFSGYYLQAVSLSCNVGDIDTMRLLDKLNPNRDLGESAMSGMGRAARYLGNESYEEGLPTVGLEQRRVFKAGDAGGIAGALQRALDDQRKPKPSSDKPKGKEGFDSKDPKWKLDKFQGQVTAYRQDKFRKNMRLSSDEMTAAMDIANAYDQALQSGLSEKEAKAVVKAATKRYEQTFNTRQARGIEKVIDETQERVNKGKFKYAPSAVASIGKGTIKDLQTNVNLSVGKMLEVNITSGDSTAIIPVNVRLIVKTVVGARMAALLTSATQDTSVKTRYHKWRSGELRFVQDLLLCQDIIDKHKSSVMADKDGSLRTIVNRGSKNRFAALLSGDISVANASSMVVVSSTTAKQIERELSGKLDNFRTREKLFKSTHTMIMVVVDPEWEQAVIYHRSIRDESVISVKEFTNASKGDGVNINEVLSAYKLGAAPNI